MGVYTREKNLRLPENSYETVRLVAEYLGQCTRNLSIHAARLHRKRLYYTCGTGTESPGSGGEGGKGDRERECETEIKRQRDEGAKERRRKRGERANRGS